MGHLTQKDFFDLTDASTSASRKGELSRHISECPRCRREFDFQRALDTSMRKEPFVTISSRYIAQILSRVTLSRSTRIPSKWFTVVAALIPLVLGGLIIAGAFLIGVPETQSSDSGIGGVITGFVEHSYDVLKGAITSSTADLAKTIQPEKTRSDESLILTVGFAVLLLLLLDRFVVRRVTRFRH